MFGLRQLVRIPHCVAMRNSEQKYKIRRKLQVLWKGERYKIIAIPKSTLKLKLILQNYGEYDVLMLFRLSLPRCLLEFRYRLILY